MSGELCLQPLPLLYWPKSRNGSGEEGSVSLWDAQFRMYRIYAQEEEREREGWARLMRPVV